MPSRKFSSGRTTTHRSLDETKRERSGEVQSDATPFVDDKDTPTEGSVHIPAGEHHTECYRLATFRQFPKSAPVKKQDLARVGYYFSGYRDRVKCFSCGAQMENWIPSDNALSASHHCQDCAMALGTDEMNIPLPRVIHHLIREIIEAIARGSQKISISVDVEPVEQENGPVHAQEAENQQAEEQEIGRLDDIVPGPRAAVHLEDAMGIESGEQTEDDGENSGNRADEAVGVERPSHRRGNSDSSEASPAKKMRQLSPGPHNRDPGQDGEE